MIAQVNWLMMAVSFVSLIGFGFGGLLVSQAQAREQKSKRRMADLVAPYRRHHQARGEIFRPAPKSNKSLLDMTSGVFGFYFSTTDQYPVKWWLVLGITFFISRIIAGFIVSIIGPFGLISWPILWVTMCRFFFGQVVGHRRKLLLRQFPDALDMIVRSAKVGIPVLGAISAVAREAQPPTSVEFTRFANELTVGMSLEEAVTQMGARTGLPEYRFFAIAIGLQARAGGALSETLENLADLIRKRLALKERAHALSSEARTSAMILGALPVVTGTGLTVVNPAYMALFVTTSAGHAVLGCAVLSLAIGALVMWTIIKKSLS